MNKFYKIIAIIIISALIFTGCVNKKNEDIQTSIKNDSIVYDIGEVPENLITFKQKNIKANEILRTLFSGLVDEDPKTMEIIPALAEKWEVSKDKTQYTFHIRGDARWSDGKKITAQDFSDFFKGILSAKANNVYAYDLRCIYGEEDYNLGKISFDKVAVNAVNDSTLSIRLNSPCDYFLSVLAEPQFFLREINDNTENWKKNYLKMKYTGAFKVSYISKGLITLKKNDDYFFKDSIKKNELKLKFYNDTENVSAYSVTDFDSNSIDVFSNPPISEINRLKQNDHVKNFSTFNIGALYFNMNKSSDVNFRKAINLLTSRSQLTRDISQEVISPIYNFIPSNVRQNCITTNMFGEAIPLEGVNELKQSDYNSNSKVVLVYEDNSFNRNLCQKYADSINENIQAIDKSKKINFELRGYNKNDLYEILKNGEYDMFFGEYNISFNNVMSFLEMFSSKSPFNINKYSSSNYDDLMYSFANSSNLSKNNDYYYKMIKQLTADLPVIPIFIRNKMVCMSPVVSELNENEYGDIIISSIK